MQTAEAGMEMGDKACGREIGESGMGKWQWGMRKYKAKSMRHRAKGKEYRYVSLKLIG